MTPAEQLAKFLSEVPDKDSMGYALYLIEHRAELLALLGGDKETSYEEEAPGYFDARLVDEIGYTRLWSAYGLWLYPGDEVWTFKNTP